VWFITDVEFRKLNGPGRHSSGKVRLLEDFLDGVICLNNDMVVLEVWA